MATMTRLVDEEEVRELGPESDTVLAELQGYFPDTVLTGWSARTGRVYHPYADARHGYFLEVRVELVGGTKAHEDIDANNLEPPLNRRVRDEIVAQATSVARVICNPCQPS